MLKQLRTPLFDDQSRYVDRFGLLLVATIIALAVQSLVDTRTTSGTTETNFGTLLLSGFVGLTFVLALRAAGVANFWQRIADLIVFVGLLTLLVMIVINATTDFDVSTFSRKGSAVARAVLASIAPIAVVRRVSTHRNVSAGTVIGAISAYLLLALAFSYIFVSIDVLQSTDFFGQPESSTRFTYFSLVTMTTLGYGDLTPSSELAGLAATAEAVIGQLFLVTFIALLVGQLILARSIKDSKD
jgi:hypothetical protein